MENQNLHCCEAEWKSEDCYLAYTQENQYHKGEIERTESEFGFNVEMKLWNKSQAVRQHNFKLWGSTDSNTDSNTATMEKSCILESTKAAGIMEV